MALKDFTLPISLNYLPSPACHSTWQSQILTQSGTRLVIDKAIHSDTAQPDKTLAKQRHAQVKNPPHARTTVSSFALCHLKIHFALIPHWIHSELSTVPCVLFSDCQSLHRAAECPLAAFPRRRDWMIWCDFKTLWQYGQISTVQRHLLDCSRQSRMNLSMSTQGSDDSRCCYDTEQTAYQIFAGLIHSLLQTGHDRNITTSPLPSAFTT